MDDYFKCLIGNKVCIADIIRQNYIKFCFLLRIFSCCLKANLRAESKICLEDIRAHNYHEEISVNLNDLNSFHQRHEEWLIFHVYNDIPLPCAIFITADRDK